MTAAVHGDTSRNYNRIMNQNAVALYQQNQTPHYHTHNQHYLSALQKSTPLRSSAVTLPESQSVMYSTLFFYFLIFFFLFRLSTCHTSTITLCRLKISNFSHCFHTKLALLL